MQLTVTPSELSRIVHAATKATVRISPWPHLSSLRLSAREDGLWASGTDLRTLIHSRCDADIQKQGEICLPAAELAALCKALPSAPVKISSTVRGVEINAGSYKGRVTGMPANEFPPDPELPDDAEMIDMPSDVFRRVAELVTWCTGDADHVGEHTMLVGVSWGTDGTFTGFDRYQFAHLKTEAAPPVPVILPPAFFQMAGGMFAGDVHVHVSPSRVSVEMPDGELTMQTIAGTYPRVHFPAEFTGEVVVPRKHFVSVLQRLDVLAPQLNAVVDFTVDLATDVELSVENPQRGEAREILGARFTGAPTSFTLDIRRTLAGVRALDKLGAKEIRIRQSSGKPAILFDSADDDLRDFMVLLAPITKAQPAARSA